MIKKDLSCYQDLLEHVNHDIVCVENEDMVSLKCNTCNTVLILFTDPQTLNKEWKYKQSRYNLWAHEMEVAGLDVEHRELHGFYKGPTVKCQRHEFGEIILCSNVPSQYDTYGHHGQGYIIYPK